MTATDQLLQIGDVISVGPDDYFVSYDGVAGPLRMRVIHAACDLQYVTGLTWVKLMGVPIDAQGREGAQIAAQVRVAALHANPPERPAPQRPAPQQPNHEHATPEIPR